MEVTKRKEELLAFLELNANNTGAGIALRNFLRESTPTNRFDDALLQGQEEEPSSGESEEPTEDNEETIEEVRDNEDARDDEDFIVMVPPKGKKKGLETKKIAKPLSSKVSNSKKRKCEFCGTVETPMWRRGPTGKGTLCNACGVKWSLKFRKRAGKKSAKINKDEPREQRQSLRKKVPSKKSVEPILPNSELSFQMTKDESEDHLANIGLCCNHAIRKKRVRDEEADPSILPAIKKRDTSNDEDSLSDEAPFTSNKLLGRLLNVVEVQLGEEEEIDKVKKQLKDLREQLDTKDKNINRQFESTKVQALQEFLEFKTEYANLEHHKIAQECSQTLAEFENSIKNQMDEMRKALGSAANNGLGKRFERFSSELSEMQYKMQTQLEALKAGTMRMENLLSTKEDKIHAELASLKKESERDFADLHRKVERVEESLHKGS